MGGSGVTIGHTAVPNHGGKKAGSNLFKKGKSSAAKKIRARG